MSSSFVNFRRRDNGLWAAPQYYHEPIPPAEWIGWTNDRSYAIDYHPEQIREAARARGVEVGNIESVSIDKEIK